MLEVREWITLALGCLGFMLTWTGMVIAVTRAVTAIKTSTDEKIEEETDKITARMNSIIRDFHEEQKTQDDRYGETASAIREYVSLVEKKVYEVELWGRDNFVLRPDFNVSTSRLETSIDRMATDVKDDFKTVYKKLDNISSMAAQSRVPTGSGREGAG